ncbi:Hypothetical protein DHA2_153959, partial [Giardia duodenalis]
VGSQDSSASVSQAPQLLFLVEGFTWVTCGSIPMSGASDWCHHWLRPSVALGAPSTGQEGGLLPLRAPTPSADRRVAVVTVEDECVVDMSNERGISFSSW